MTPARDPYKYFRIEARELLEQMGKGVLDLEKGGAVAEIVPRVLRLAHTLKGAARVVKQRDTADLAHALEDALAPVRDGATPIGRELIDRMLKLLDGIRARLAALSTPAPDDGVATPASAPELFRSLRTDVAEVDALLDGLAAVHAVLASLRRGLGSVERLRHLSELLAQQHASPRARNLGEGTSMKARSLAEELRGQTAVVERRLTGDIEQADRELRQVRDAAQQLRLVPAHLIFHGIELAARDTAASLGKWVAFEPIGGDLRLDPHTLAVVQPALVQVVRNAVAHGIETPAERTAAGKPPGGRVSLAVIRRGGRLSFVCHDDGRGIDLPAVRRAAERRGLLLPEAEAMGPGELLRVLLRGGITTSATVTPVAGRGVGLDVVREAADRLGGEVVAKTEAGAGTTIELVVPLSLSSMEALIVEAAGRTAAIPLDAVRSTLRVGAGQVAQAAGGQTIIFDGKVVPFAPLARSLRAEPQGEAPAVWSAVLVESGGAMAALGVDRVVGVESVVLRPLPEGTPADRAVAGACLDAEGNPRIVLAPDALVADAPRAVAAPSAAAARCAPLLIIDDSLTTRMLEQSILESAGYDVDVAISGEEAVEKARRQTYAMFLVDVEMPGMDGFTFIERARADPALRDIPAILVTSRTSAEDRRRGEEVGARGYIVKNEFDQAELLGMIRRMVGLR